MEKSAHKLLLLERIAELETRKKKIDDKWVETEEREFWLENFMK